MKFYIGTQNHKQVSTAKKVITEILGSNDFTIDGIDIDSGVGETPHDEDTMLGAKNRATTLSKKEDCDFGIGLESGLVERYGQIYEEAWCCVVTEDATFLGYSSGLKVPDIITRRMNDDRLEHFQVMREIKHLLPIKGEKDTWGNYSALKLTRELSFEEALRNTLVQAFAHADSLYNM